MTEPSPRSWIACIKRVLGNGRSCSQKKWDEVFPSLEVYRHAGEPVIEDPKRQEGYRQQVLKEFGLDPWVPERWSWLTAEDGAAIAEVIRRKTGAFWIPGTPRTTGAGKLRMG